MPSNGDRIAARLADIVLNIDKARKFIARHSREQFLEDELTAYAVLRALEIVSEASKHIPHDMKARHAGIDWQEIKAAGNVYRHEYKGVDLDVVWNTVQLHLDDLRKAAVAELERLGRTDLLVERP